MDGPVKFNRSCSYEGCGKPHLANGLCSMHYSRVYRHGDPEYQRISYLNGENHGSWIGDEVGYQGAHRRTRYQRGNPSEHSCIDCGQQAQEWSYNYEDPDEKVSEQRLSIGMLYSPDPGFYDPRCIRCHKRFDSRRKGV